MMIKKKITIKSQHIARKNQALLSQFATLKLTSTNASVRYGHRGLPLTVPAVKLAFIVVSLSVRSTDFPGLPQSLSTFNQTDTFRDSSPSSALFSLGTFDTVTGIWNSEETNVIRICQTQNTELYDSNGSCRRSTAEVIGTINWILSIEVSYAKLLVLEECSVDLCVNLGFSSVQGLNIRLIGFPLIFFLSNARRDMNINEPKIHKHAINMKIKESGLLRNKSIEHKTFLVIY